MISTAQLASSRFAHNVLCLESTIFVTSLKSLNSFIKNAPTLALPFEDENSILIKSLLILDEALAKKIPHCQLSKRSQREVAGEVLLQVECRQRIKNRFLVRVHY